MNRYNFSHFSAAAAPASQRLDSAYILRTITVTNPDPIFRNHQANIGSFGHGIGCFYSSNWTASFYQSEGFRDMLLSSFH